MRMVTQMLMKAQLAVKKRKDDLPKREKIEKLIKMRLEEGKRFNKKQQSRSSIQTRLVK